MGSIKEYKCPNCGGAIEFDSHSQKVKCPYCDTEFDINIFEELSALEEQTMVSSDEPIWETDAGSQWQESEESNMKVFSCNACGGEIIADANTAALRCPYCDNPVVFTGNLSGSLKPDLIIPFKLDKRKAKAQYYEHVKNKALLPKVFKDENHIDEIKGVYVPFWLFDGRAEAEVQYKASKIRMWSDADFNYTETQFFKVFRAGNMSFEKIPVDGSTQMPDDLMESIEPFDYSEAVDFNTAYLAGYLADKYDVSAEESKDRANRRIENSMESSLRESVIGYNTVNVERNNMQLSKSIVHYGLLPVWILNTSYQGKKYVFAMNGQTGKFVGNLPVDQGLYWKNFGITAGIASIAAFFLLNLISFFI